MAYEEMGLFILKKKKTSGDLIFHSHVLNWSCREDHRIIESFGLEGTFKDHLVQPPLS